MIYKTLSECLEECRKTGTLRVEGITSDEYALRKAGFRPRLVGNLSRPAFLPSFQY